MNPEPQRSAALVSLTATYTDSEGEEGSASDDDKASLNQFDKHFASRESTPTLISTFPEVSTGNLKNSLVSYFSNEGVGEEDEDEDGIKIVDSSYSDTENLGKQTPTKIGDPNQRPLSPIAYHRTLLTLSSPDEIKLPPEFPGRCSNTLQEKISKHYDKKIREGKNMNEAIQRRKDFRNPSIYEKLVSYCGIDEKGTNYPPEIYDPHCWGQESFYDELAKRQKEEMDKREKERKDRTKVEFISGTVKKPQDAASLAGGAAIEVPRRKSKWDMAMGGNQVMAPSNLKPAVLVTPNVVGSATGTKPTVISAFGTISKKGKP